MSVNLTIKMIQTGGNQFSINTDLTNTVAELKEQIAIKAGLPKDNVRLVCAGRIWQDVATVGSYEPREDAIVHCLNNPPRTTLPASEQTLSVANPLLGGSTSPQPVAEGDPFSQMMAQSQQMMSQNPEMMQQMMESPMVQQMMSNPEIMRSMLRMNPQMNQLMEQRPEIARMMEDPETLRQSMQMMRNPALMREMQRNQDLAMGHLDVMPGGHDALMRAHEDVIDPVMSALTGSNQNTPNSAVDVDAYSRQTEGTPNNDALPNAWGAPRAATTVAQQTATPSAAAPFAAPPALSGLTAASGAQSQNSNPMAPMMQQMMNNPAMMQQAMQMAGQMYGGGAQAGDSGATSLPQAPQSMTPSGAPVPPDPMAAMRQQMMQQMMSNPAMMQQSMQMANQLFGQQGTLAPSPTDPPPMTPSATNPFASMMEQLSSNPAMMQQSMQMAQTMFGNQAGGAPGLPGLFGTPAMSPGASDPAGAPSAGVDALARVRFAAQLAQLTSMGFCNEAACLRALQQHMGRVDAAIDTLLANGEGSA